MTTLNPIQLLNPTGSTSGQAIVSTGASSVPGWSNALAISGGTINGTLIGNTTPAAATFSSATINGGAINGTTVGSVTPAPGAFTTLSATGLVTPSSTVGIKGTTTNDSANAGSVGEFVTNSATGVAMTSPTAGNITSISLTAGDWDVNGDMAFNAGAGATPTTIDSSISTTSATQGPLGSRARIQTTFATSGTQYLVTPVVRLSLTTTTTVFLVGASTFSGGTLTCDGLIRARRVR